MKAGRPEATAESKEQGGMEGQGIICDLCFMLTSGKLHIYAK